MVKLTIDGTELQVKDGTTILDAALQAGIHIPTLCYLKKLNKIGACRVCMVEVEGNSKLVTACNTRALNWWFPRPKTKPCPPMGETMIFIPPSRA